MDEIDRAWAEHQEWERERRRPRTLEEIAWAKEQAEQRRLARERMWAEVLHAKAVVEADFERWAREARQASV